jgi:SAM-dependent methyltransferase
MVALTLGAGGTRLAGADAKDEEWLKSKSPHFRVPIVRLSGVFKTREAEWIVLPFMKEYGDLFEGKSVLEIGCGSGIVSVFAASLGASKVVATDIDERAIRSVTENARRQGYATIVDARLVPPDDMTAFSVIGDDEQFDIILSNPPYALDLDALKNTPATDTGDLGFSIVRGFDEHVTPGGLAMLYYGSFFYHDVMVKFARHEGLAVRNNRAQFIAPWEAATLFNTYLARFLEYQNLDSDAFSFAESELRNLRNVEDHPPLFPGRKQNAQPGWIILRRPSEGPRS